MDQRQWRELQGWVVSRDDVHPKVSHWSVGQQIAHCCLVVESVARALQDSVPPAPRAKLTAVRLGVFWTGRIPRGRAKAPRRAHPEPGHSTQELNSRLGEAERNMQAIRSLAPDAWFRHFVFDVLKRDQSLRFLRIHTDHHLRIIAEISRDSKKLTGGS